MIKSRFLRESLSAYRSIVEIDPERVGEISKDRSAVVGRNNWCFIYEGSNGYRRSYISRDFLSLGDAWARVIEARQSYCNRQGIQFLQVIIPNKATLLPECYPEILPTDMSFPLQGLLASNVDANLLVPIAEFRSESVREAIFRRNDSHLTVAGNVYLMELILEKLELSDFHSDVIDTHRVSHVGDLGGKFETVLSELCHAPIWNKGLLNQESVEKVKDVQAVGFNGIEQLFLNPIAPINSKVAVIGNSFFERVPSWGASPFCSALFQEYLFRWSPTLEFSAIGCNTEILICQTCERFLNRVPEDVFDYWM